MCYNAQVSGGTFIFVSLICGWLWQRNTGIDRAIAGILFFIGLMQALEWILWTHLDCGWINKIVSRLIHVYIAIQPVVANFIVWFYNAGWAPGYWYLGVLSLLFVPVVAWRSREIQGQCTRLGPKGNLVWPGVPGKGVDSKLIRLVYYATLLYPILTLKNTTFSALYSVAAAVSLWYYQGKSEQSWPSLWCHFVNLLAVFAVLRPAP
jgi:hypothetical protein